MIAFLLAVAGCSETHDESRFEATPPARKAIGLAADYVPESLSPDDVARLGKSMLARRSLAWHAVAKALRPATMNLPAWATWYARDDFQRIFHQLYDGIGKDRRATRDPFTAPEITRAFAWNLRAVDELPHWPKDRYDAWLASLDTEAKQRGAAGLSRTFYAPGALTPFLETYENIENCLPKLPDAECLPGAFGKSAAVAKTAWKRRDFGLKVPVFDTDAQSLSRRLARHEQSWGSPDREKSPDAEEIYTIETESGATFQLAGLHLMTKELDEWLWITLWWSDDPGTDFGADRPEELRALGGPWSHYKMCVVTAYDDDGSVEPELEAKFPTLAAALNSAAKDTAPYSWCSNPHIEEGVANQRSNCIGCHQHAGTQLKLQDILTDEASFPGHGSARLRRSFPADYLWSFAREPERLSGYIHQQINHYDIYDRL